MSRVTKILIILCIFTGLGAIDIDQTDTEADFPMAIKVLRKRKYPGGDFLIEKKLSNGTNYSQFKVSYLSEGLKIYGLLTVPTSPKPEKGYPAILFVHGYIPPKKYTTTGSYPTYQAALAQRGFITFKPDLRGHGNSEGEAVSAHYSEKYVVDIMYAISYLKNFREADPKRLGYWGHSNGGETGLRVLVISSDIKAASFWAGVVGSYKDMLETYNNKIRFLKNGDNPLVAKYGLPGKNNEFWNRLDPYSFLNDISAPVQLHHGTADKSVPIELSIHLKEELQKLNKKVEYYEYTGDDHNISRNSDIAWQRTITFFKNELK
ncbi:MAG: prolyl oligopeptidase family serine peptidase [bacterium]|nr:prolyl oligopeptidase family serine peptidase [bacterium]